MKSKAQIKSHPLHPMLIPFPFAFLVGAFVADVLGYVYMVPGLWATATYATLAGVVTALVAAVPGFVDYVYVLPPRSSGRRRATKHMLVNLGAVALFALAGWIRGGPEIPPDPALLVIEGAGVVLLMIGGWMGGTLVYRNLAGVDMRYADAGKWKESSFSAQEGRPLVVADQDELQLNQMKLLRVDGRRIVLARSEEGYVAFDDHCSHRGGSLAGGMMICGTVQCPWHGSQFDVRTGAVKAGPAEEPVLTHTVRVVDGRVELSTDEIR
jgi:nitrite reductase/ring-hydroxylating ferredoxin subunit/uncharacterized membrane protein